jgi:AcrR family transcriptional regulator
MRALAEQLDTSTPTLYRHVDGKDDLMVHVVDKVLGVIAPTAEKQDSASWQEATTGPPSESSMEAWMSTSFIGCPSPKARAAARLTTPFPNRRGCNVRAVEKSPPRGGRTPRIAIVD